MELKKLELKWSSCKDPLFDTIIVIDNIPKKELKRLSKQYNVEKQHIGIYELIELSCGGLKIKFRRVRKLK